MSEESFEVIRSADLEDGFVLVPTTESFSAARAGFRMAEQNKAYILMHEKIAEGKSHE